MTSGFFQAESTSVKFWSTQCELYKFCLARVELNSCCSAQRVLCLLLSLPLFSILLSVVTEFLSWDMCAEWFKKILCVHLVPQNAEKVKHARRFWSGHWTFLGLGSEKQWYASSSHAEEGQWNCTAAKMVQRLKLIGHIVFKSISSLSRGSLKKKQCKTSIQFNGNYMNTNNPFFKSAQCLRSSGELVFSIRTDRSGLTEEEKGRASTLVDNKILTSVPPEEVQFLISPPTEGDQKHDARNSWVSTSKPGRYSWHNYLKKLSSNIPLQPGNSTIFERVRTTDGEQLLLCAEKTRILDLIWKPNIRQLLPKAQPLDQALEVHIVIILDGFALEVAIPSNASPMDTSYVV